MQTVSSPTAPPSDGNMVSTRLFDKYLAMFLEGEPMIDTRRYKVVFTNSKHGFQCSAEVANKYRNRPGVREIIQLG